ncbi:hypothetical protein [Stenotrophomonas sp. GD03657]|uniref:hypothetical protein n=1 Tax=Stenotrophomonas sp. GD03657 TaxID=2975363 RepID=UPI002449A0A7|nr:hypothetical protein [Stenotrophomonas sp. GD03657]MDH2154152.1 hypothetical protein [Stenotrophomonas sp. GD03657]
MSEFNDIAEEKPASFTKEDFAARAAQTILLGLARNIMDRHCEGVPLTSSPYNLAAAFFGPNEKSVQDAILDKVRESKTIDSIHLDPVSLEKGLTAKFTIRLNPEDPPKIQGNLLSIAGHAWNVLTWKHYAVEEEKLIEDEYVKLNMRVVSITGLSNDDRESGVATRQRFRRMFHEFKFDTAALPAQLRDLLNRTSEDRFNIPLCWTRQFVPAELAREFQDMYNDLAECQEQAGCFVVELYNGNAEERDNRVATLKLVPRVPVSGVCVFEYLVDILHIDTY